MEESLQRGQAFEELVRTNGWKLVKTYFQTKIQNFANAILIESGKSIEEFEKERMELVGIRKLLGYIENDLKNLEDDRKKAEEAKRSTKK